MKKYLFIIALFAVVLSVISVGIFASVKASVEPEKTEKKDNTINYSAEDLQNTDEDAPEKVKTNIEKATEIAEKNNEMLLDMAKAALAQQYPNFADINPENLEVEMGYSYGGNADGSTKYGIKFRFDHYLCGVYTYEFYEVTLYTVDGENFEAKNLYAHLQGEFSSFEDKVTDELFEKAADDVLAKFEEKLAACNTDAEREALWLTVCDCPVGFENHRDMLHWAVNDGKLYVTFGRFSAGYVYEMAG